MKCKILIHLTFNINNLHDDINIFNIELPPLHIKLNIKHIKHSYYTS